MNNLLTTLAALAAVGTGTALAIFDSVPLVTDALTGAGLGGFVGGLIACRRERIAAGALLGVVGETIGFSGWAYLAGLVVAMVMVSLVDRDGFYGTSPR